MATFQVQVEDLTGTIGDTTAITSWLTDGAKEIINILPANKKALAASTNTLNNSSPTLTINGGDVLDVTRSDGTIDRPCRIVSPLLRGKMQDTADINYVTKSDPVYYILNNTLTVYPTPTASETASISKVAYPAVAYGDSAISVFPDDFEHLVVLYAGIKGLQRRMNDQLGNSSITTALAAVKAEVDECLTIADNVHTQIGSAVTAIGTANTEIGLAKTEAAEIVTQTDNAGEIETALDAMKTELDKVDNVIDLANDEFDEVAVEISATATSPISAARSAAPSIISVDDLNINAVLPPAPSISTVSYSDASNADASVTAVTTATASAPSIIDVSGNAPTYAKPGIVTRVAFSGYTSGLSETDPGSFSITTPTPSVPSISTVSYSNASGGDASVTAVATATASAPDKANIAGDVPTYSKPSVTSQVAFESYWTLGDFGDNDPGDLAITATAPAPPSAPSFSTPAISPITVGDETVGSMPDVSSTTITSLGVPPTYTSPTVTGDGTELTDVDDLDTDNTIDVHADQIEFDQWWSTVTHLIEGSEDIELANATLQKISTYINAYSQAMTNRLNTFNKENVAYQAKVQEAIQQAQINAQTAQQQAQIDKDKVTQQAQLSAQTKQTQAQIDAQDAQQEASLKLQKENQEYSASLQKYSAEVNKYQADVNKDVSVYQQKMARYQLELNTVYTAWAKTESDNIMLIYKMS